jgi:aryl-alcohol dehydrogenase-like predicted oxidoreductase
MSLSDYRTLGRSGLGVSPLDLGTMTFGTARWGMGESSSRGLNGANPFGDTLFTDRNWEIVDVVRRVATECGESVARVALAWVMQRPGVTSTLMGVSSIAQFKENIAALDTCLSAAHLAELDKVSAPTQKMLYSLFTPQLRQHAVFGGSTVRGWAAKYAARNPL